MFSRYNELQEMMEGSPSLIEKQWPGIPYPIDAAVFFDGSYISFLSAFSFIKLATHREIYILSTVRPIKNNKIKSLKTKLSEALAINSDKMTTASDT